MNQLTIIDQQAPQELFAPGAVRGVIDAIATEARALAGALDPATPAGRKELASLAHKVARSKVALDEAGKKLTEEARATIDAVNAERRLVREELDALKDEIRKPVTEFEEREKARIEGHERKLAEIGEKAAVALASRDPIEIEDAELFLDGIDVSTFEEFRTRAETERDSGLHRLAKLAEEIRAEQAEAARIAKEKAEAEAKERAEREARIAAEAAERAKREAEEDARAAAEAEAARVAEEKRKAEEAREAERRAEAERLAAIEREKAEAEARAKEAQERAEREAKEAEERRKRDVAEAEARAAAEAKRREEVRLAAEETARHVAEKKAANEMHRAKVRAEATESIRCLGISVETSAEIVAAIESGQVANVTLNF